MKRIKFIAGLSLIVQSLAFFVLFLVYWKKNKSLAKAFAAVSAAGGIGGAVLLALDANCKNNCCCEEYEEEYMDEDFEDFDVCEDDILCSFDEENVEAKEENAE